MNFRYEYKFLLNYPYYLKLRNTFKKIMRLDENSIDEKGYHIRSIYYDDVYDSAYNEKMAGLVNRKKYRVRIYNYSESRIKLEIKRKYGECTNKLSTSITMDEYEKVYNADVGIFMNSDDLIKRSYYLEERNALLRPKVIVDYFREAYVLPFNDIRITFDNDLSFARPTMDIFTDKLLSRRLSDEYSRILEVKYNNFLPNYLKEMIESYDLTRLSVSKFSLCRERI